MIRTKYAALIHMVDDTALYSPSSMAQFVVQEGLLDHTSRTRFRHVLSRIKRSCSFPPEGDGSVLILQGAVQPAWTGKRWKAAVQPREEVGGYLP